MVEQRPNRWLVEFTLRDFGGVSLVGSNRFSCQLEAVGAYFTSGEPFAASRVADERPEKPPDRLDPAARKHYSCLLTSPTFFIVSEPACRRWLKGPARSKSERSRLFPATDLSSRLVFTRHPPLGKCESYVTGRIRAVAAEQRNPLR